MGKIKFNFKKKKPETTKSPRLRSPNYPGIGLRAAVEFVGKLVEKDGKAGAKNEIALKHMGFSGAHGHARAVVSSLKKFNLAELVGGKVIPTQAAIDIVRFPENHPRRVTALRDCALKPAIYKDIIDRYATIGEIPGDESFEPELETDWEFNPKAVADFLLDFRDSLTFAGLLDGNKLLLSSIELIEWGTGTGTGSDTGQVESTMLALPPAPAKPMDIKPQSPINRAATQSRPQQPDLGPQFAGPSIRFGLAHGNEIEIRMKSKVSRLEFAEVKKIFDLSSIAFIHEGEAMMTLLLTRNLTLVEKEKVVRLDIDLAKIFHNAGKAVRVCEGYMADDVRMIGFVENSMSGPPWCAAMPSQVFITAPDEQILKELKEQVAQ